jgi:hypothetical protein
VSGFVELMARVLRYCLDFERGVREDVTVNGASGVVDGGLEYFEK